MALNNSSLIKQGTSLKEVSESAYTNAMSTPGQQPSTAFGALKLGANQDQAKMIGTPAQKQKLAQDNLTATKAPQPSPQQTLQQSQRITSEPAPQSDASQAKDKMDRFSQLGSMGLRLEGMIQQKLNAAKATQATTVLDQTKINALAPAQQQSAQDALQGYLTARSSGDQEAIQQSLKAVANSLGLAAVDEKTIQQYFTAQGMEGGFDQAQKVTLGQLDLSEMGGAEQIAADLGVGPDALANFSLEDFNKAIQDLESKEFNRVQELQAVLANPASPQQQEAALRELRALGYAGQTGTEQRFDTTQQQVTDSASQSVLKLGDREFSIEDITQDKELGELIKNVASDEATLDEWLNSDDPETRSIAEWIKSNKDSIAATQMQMGAEAKSFRDVQKSMDDYRGNIPAAFANALFEDEGYMTNEEWLAKKEQLDANSAIQALKADPSLQTMIDTSDLAWMQQISPEEIKAQADLTEKVADSLGLQSLLEDSGIDGTKIVNPDDNEVVQSAMEMYEKWGSNDSLVGDKELMKAFESGLISDSVREKLVKRPENRGAVMAVLKFQSEVDDMFSEAMSDNKIDNEEMSKLLDTVGLGSLSKSKDAIAQLNLLAGLGNAEAIQKVKLLASFGIDKNGNISDPAKFKEAIASGRSIDDAALSAKSNSKYTADQFSSVKDANWNVLADIVKDGKWSPTEIKSLTAMSPNNLSKFISSVGIKNIPGDVVEKIFNQSFTNFKDSPPFKNSLINKNGILDVDMNGNYTHNLSTLTPSGWRGSPKHVSKVADMLGRFDGMEPSAVLSSIGKDFDSMIEMLNKDLVNAQDMGKSIPSSIASNIQKQINNLQKQKDSAISNMRGLINSAIKPGETTISATKLGEWQDALNFTTGNVREKLLKNGTAAGGMYIRPTPHPYAMEKYGVKAAHPESWLWSGVIAQLKTAYPNDTQESITQRVHDYFFKPPYGAAIIK